MAFAHFPFSVTWQQKVGVNLGDRKTKDNVKRLCFAPKIFICHTCLTKQKTGVVSWKAGRLFPVKSSDTRHYRQMSKPNYLSDFCLCCFYLHTDCIIAVTALWCSPVGLLNVWFSYFHLPVCPALLCISFSTSLSLLLRLSFPSSPMCLFLFLIYLS